MKRRRETPCLLKFAIYKCGGSGLNSRARRGNCNGRGASREGISMRNKFAIGLAAVSLVWASLAEAKDWKTVVIGMEGAYEPYNLTDPSGKIVGFEPDLVMDLCGRMKVECKIIAQDWDGMIPGLQAGKFDVIMDGMSITEERMKEIDFSKPYAASPGAFMAPKDSPLAKAVGAGKVINISK